jgi:hypothetical protein
MDRFDRNILNYMLMWDPHGGLFDEDQQTQQLDVDA